MRFVYAALIAVGQSHCLNILFIITQPILEPLKIFPTGRQCGYPLVLLGLLLYCCCFCCCDAAVDSGGLTHAFLPLQILRLDSTPLAKEFQKGMI